MKYLDSVMLVLGVLGMVFCFYVAYGNPNAPAAQMQVMTTASAALALAGYIGWRIERKR